MAKTVGWWVTILVDPERYAPGRGHAVGAIIEMRPGFSDGPHFAMKPEAEACVKRVFVDDVRQPSLVPKFQKLDLDTADVLTKAGVESLAKGV